jgi:hypothetical protein
MDVLVHEPLARQVHDAGAGAVGELLMAEAKEVVLTGRTGVYDVTVTDEKGQIVQIATAVAGPGNVDDQLEVKNSNL